VNLAINSEKYQLRVVNSSDSRCPTNGSTYRRSRSAHVCREYLKWQIVAIHEGACLNNEKYVKLMNETYASGNAAPNLLSISTPKLSYISWSEHEYLPHCCLRILQPSLGMAPRKIWAVDTLILCTLLDSMVSYRVFMSPSATQQNWT
jgi:hypothetical protein